ncbi:hypothetical protein ACRAKI_20455 [Saccharothrix isguenensis]
MPVPVAVICQMPGVPVADRDRFTGWIDVAPAATAFSSEEIHDAFAKSKDYVAGLVADRRREPGDDLLGALVEARDTEDRLGEGELVVLRVPLLRRPNLPSLDRWLT